MIEAGESETDSSLEYWISEQLADRGTLHATGPELELTIRAPSADVGQYRGDEGRCRTEEYATPDECCAGGGCLSAVEDLRHFQQLSAIRHGETVAIVDVQYEGPAIIAADGHVIYEQHGNSGFGMTRGSARWHMGIGIDFIRREIGPRREYYEDRRAVVRPDEEALHA